MTVGPPEDYVLPEARNRQIFQERIVPDLLSRQTPQEPPTAVVIVGQPGAGKTRIAQNVAQQLASRGGHAEIDSDLYKAYHPQYGALMAVDDQLMSRYIGPDGRAWMRQAQDHVRTQRLNALIHEIATDPAYFAETVRAYRKARFPVEVMVVAVAEALSQQGILNRYYEQVRERGQGRLTVPEKAAASYTGIVASVDLVEREELVDFIAVYRRGEVLPRYAGERGTRGAAAAVEEERARPWTQAESWDFLGVQDKLRSAKEMTAFGPQLDRIEELAAPLLAPQVVRQRAAVRTAGRGQMPLSLPPSEPSRGEGPAPRPGTGQSERDSGPER